MAEVRVRDRGPGICKEDQAKLFQVGVTLSTRPTAGEPQTGIGLALTAELVRAMKGEIFCESEPGRGSTFGFRLPAGAQAPARTKGSP
jgi:signal transduction histidine kinase